MLQLISQLTQNDKIGVNSYVKDVLTDFQAFSYLIGKAHKGTSPK